MSIRRLKFPVGSTTSANRAKSVFPILRDGTGLMQCVAVKSALPEELFEALKHLTQESSLIVRGKIRAEPRAPGDASKWMSRSADILQKVSEADHLPLSRRKTTASEFLMDHRHLWLRSPAPTPPSSRVPPRNHHRSPAIDFASHGFTLVDTPIFTPAACEGYHHAFRSELLRRRKSLPLAIRPTLQRSNRDGIRQSLLLRPRRSRAEKSKTRRHLTEFWMVEPRNGAFARPRRSEASSRRNGRLYRRTRCSENRREELKVLERDTTKLEAIKAPFVRLSYDDAVKNLQEHGSEIQWGSDLGGGDETILTQQFDRPIMVDRFPMAIKAFYMQPDPDRPEVAMGVDVLAPEGYGEIIGGGQRIHDPELLLRRIDEHQLPREAFNWYIDLRKYGTVPHGGFGMGIERCVAWICGLEHVRETIAFPRMLYRLRP